MPELPEVESVRRRLAPVLEGRVFEHVRITDPRLTRPFDPLEVAGRLTTLHAQLMGRPTGEVALVLSVTEVFGVTCRFPGHTLVGAQLPSSITPSQSSSTPLHVSVPGVPGVHI